MIDVLGHRILIQPDKLEDTDKAYKGARDVGIVIPDFEEKLREQAGVDKGTVVAIGSTAFKDFGGEPWCAVGDRVAYAKYSGKWVTDPETEEKYLVINDEDLVCRFK